MKFNYVTHGDVVEETVVELNREVFVSGDTIKTKLNPTVRRERRVITHVEAIPWNAIRVGIVIHPIVRSYDMQYEHREALRYLEAGCSRRGYELDPHSLMLTTTLWEISAGSPLRYEATVYVPPGEQPNW